MFRFVHVCYKCGGGGGGSMETPSYTPTPAPPPPPPPIATPIFQAQEGDTGTGATVPKRTGKAKLQIPLGGATGTTGLGIPTTS